ncbi:MAG: hypothetical protein L3K17_01585 [Thermoplasmata archaeon]|nr:hypothetical protein [Thermoplasmata archaeon]
MTGFELINGGAWWEPFLAILLLVFGLFLILAGLFTAYFGSGKSRTIGVGLLVVGLVMGVLVGLLAKYSFGWSTSLLFGLIGQAFLVILAAVVGALVAIAIFLLAIMKS